MTSARSTKFEIQVLKDQHWVLQEIRGSEEEAKAFADSLIQRNNQDAVRVVRDYQRMDGTHSETVLMEKTSGGKSKADISISPVTEAPLCRKISDFMGLQSRLTFGRLARKYLDEMVLTPTEIFHSPAEMKRFADKDRLLLNAVDATATLQTKLYGEDGKTRRESLYKAWDEGMMKARTAAEAKLPAEHSFAALAGAVKAPAGDERDYQMLSLMARRLMDSRSWLGKLDLLLEWTAEAAAKPFMALIDGVVADLMIPAQVLQDLLGYQQNLGAALGQIAALALGQAEQAKFAPASFAPLNKLFAEDRLPDARQVLLSRVARELRGGSAMARNEPTQEYEAFNRLLHTLVGDTALTGGPSMAEALVRRYAAIIQVGGPNSMREAVEGLMVALSDACRRVHLLLALGDSPLGLPKSLLELLEGQIRGARSITQWVPARMPPRQRMEAMTATHAAVANARGIPEELRAELAQCLDETLLRYLVDDSVIEKIDKAEDPLAMRAIRLIKFCGSGVLIQGKSLDMAKARVLEHLRQPSFEEKFLASLGEPGQAEKQLRDFHHLLIENGFAG